MNSHTPPGTTITDDTAKPYVVAAPPRFPDVLAEITRAQPLTMLSIAFITGLVLAAGWRR